MKKKLFFLFLSIAVYAAPFTGLAAVIGENYANVDVNVRISPNATAQRIGHFKKGQKVMVEKMLGDWCHVEYKKYRRAYVYCPLLKNGSVVKQKTQPAPSIEKPLTFNEISLTYPKDWKTDISLNSLMLSSYKSEKKQFIMVIRQEYKTKTEVAKSTEEFFNRTKETLPPEMKFISDENLVIPVGKDSFKTILYTIEIDSNNFPPFGASFMLFGIAVKDNNVYTIAGISEKNNESLQEVKDIIKTFKVK